MIKYICTIAVLTTGMAFAQNDQATARINKQVRHELAMLPYYGVFDNIEFQVDGRTVTLLGQASRPTLKSDAERVIKGVEGVTGVRNNIRVLPLSPNDDRIRAAVYKRIYGTPALQKYTSNRHGPIFDSRLSKTLGITNNPPVGYHAIHIVVNNGHVTLEGMVSRQGDKDIANIKAKTVSGVFSVTNNLRVDS
ncbi:MAG TPA: BON domain-containing protein [Bryobacteraceae bacterium]|jgi:osmotically-inducible protein OsmY|nr:BON domain-containing protein [Bryobacteraceae bacterium]